MLIKSMEGLAPVVRACAHAWIGPFAWAMTALVHYSDLAKAYEFVLPSSGSGKKGQTILEHCLLLFLLLPDFVPHSSMA